MHIRDNEKHIDALRLHNIYKKLEDSSASLPLDKMDLQYEHIASKKIKSTLEEVEDTQIWQEDIIRNIVDDEDSIQACNYPFRELLLNAFEHGNLGIDSSQKHEAIANGEYWDMIEALEKDCEKSISINIFTTRYLNERYILTTITDEGEGFDISLLKDIFLKKEKFNGRGIFISKRFADAIYYNSRGNSVLIINKINSKKEIQ